MIIGDRGAFHDDSGLFEVVHHGLAHFKCRSYGYKLNSRRRRDFDRTGYENHMRPTPFRRLRNGVTHLAARTIADEPNGIDRLLRGSGCDQERLARQISFDMGQGVDELRNPDGIGQASRSGDSASEPAFARIDYGAPAKA